MSKTIYGLPTNLTFCDIWDKVADFITDYKASGIYTSNVSNRLADTDATLLYYLLYARYGNSSIASRDTNRFKYQLFSMIFQYGPTWVKKLDIQNQVRNLTADELISGGKAVYNSAYNPSTAPSTATLEELTAINEQKTTNYKKSKAEALNVQWELLNNDVSNAFLDKFRVLFISVAAPVYQIAFPVEEEDE